MGLRAKFNLVMLIVFLVGLALAASLSYMTIQQDAREETLRQARIMIDVASAVRGYTDKEIGPLLAAQNSVRFLPQTIPFFAAQTVLRELPASYHDYAYKEASLNPKNPADRATNWEADIINTFQNNPEKWELVSERDTAEGPTLNLARPVRLDNEGCLSCHSTPQRAPSSMIDLYGTEGGFGWKRGQVVGAQIVTVPMAVAFAKAHRLFLVLIGGVAAVFAATLLLSNLLLHFLIVRPVREISAAASEVSLGNLHVPEYQPRGRDEIASLASSFNRMRRSLMGAMRMLETPH
jgi:HAMP domain-containing protein